jgi:transposase InsO family protein
MDLHKNARSCPASRVLLVRRVVEEGWTVRKAAEAQGLSERAAYRWLARYRAEGVAGLEDRSSRPRRIPYRTPRERVQEIVSLRLRRMSGAEIACRTGLPRSTVARWLARAGMGRLKQLAPPEPIRRYQKEHPGELLHLDIKKLGKICGVGHRITGDKRKRARGIGWEYVHVAIDDASRLAYAEVLADERGSTAATFLRRAVTWFEQHGVTTQRILTDNGSCYISKAFQHICHLLGVKHSRTQPYRPRTNGKAERFIQTLAREWAYAFTFHTSLARVQLLEKYLHFYNHHRAHSALGGRPPYSSLNLNNLLRIDS